MKIQKILCENTQFKKQNARRPQAEVNFSQKVICEKIHPPIWHCGSKGDPLVCFLTWYVSLRSLRIWTRCCNPLRSIGTASPPSDSALLRFIYTKQKWARKRIFFIDLCCCSMWTINWILHEPIWKRCLFHFRLNIKESLKQRFVQPVVGLGFTYGRQPFPPYIFEKSHEVNTNLGCPLIRH